MKPFWMNEEENTGNLVKYGTEHPFHTFKSIIRSYFVALPCDVIT